MKCILYLVVSEYKW